MTHSKRQYCYILRHYGQDQGIETCKRHGTYAANYNA